MTRTIGQRLKAEREEQRLTLEKIFESTRIRVQYLQALEADDLSVMPSPVQARGYLRNYAEYLELDVPKLLDEMREVNAQKPSEVVVGPGDILDIQATQTIESPHTNEYAHVEDTTPLIKPKPARRKKVDSQPPGDSVITPKRRGRKKVEPTDFTVSQELEQTGEASEESLQPDKKILPLQQNTASVDPDVIRENGNSQASSLPVQEDKPAVDEPAEISVVPPLEAIDGKVETDVNDSLWQTWLHRLTSVLAARNKRPTLVVKEPDIDALESIPPLVESEPLPEQRAAGDPLAENSTQIFHEIGDEL